MSKVIFKQWLYAPNKKRTPVAIGNMLNYIATRDGVEFNMEAEVSSKFVNYIATRPGVVNNDNVAHGLFGKLQGMTAQADIGNLADTEQYIKNIAKDKKSIYNAVISLTAENAKQKDIINREDWEKIVEEQVYEISRMMDIPTRNLEYVAAVHMKEEHPHVHIMYWDKEQAIGRFYIKPELSNSIRKKLVRNLFGEEMKRAYQQKDEEKKKLGSLLWGENSEIANQKRFLHGMTPEELYKQCFEEKKDYKFVDEKDTIKQTDMYELYQQIKKDYPTGALKYKYLPPELKESLDNLTKKILDNDKEIAKQFNRYIDACKIHAEFYGNNKNMKAYLKEAEKKLYAEIGNKILNAVKEIRDIENKNTSNGNEKKTDAKKKQSNLTEKQKKYNEQTQKYKMTLLRREIFDMLYDFAHSAEIRNIRQSTGKKELSAIERAELRNKTKDEKR